MPGRRRIRVLNLCHEPSVGGAQVAVARAFDALVREGYPVELVAAAPGHGYLSRACDRVGATYLDQPLLFLGAHAEEGLGKSLVKTLFLPERAAILAGWIRLVGPDLVHVHSALLDAPAIAARLAGVPVVWTVHEMLESGSPHLEPRLGPGRTAGLISRCASAVVLTAESSLNAFNALCDMGRASLVRIGVPADRFSRNKGTRRKTRRELGLSRDQTAVLFMGLLSRKKGFHVLVEAISCLHDKVVLVAAGPGDVGWARSVIRRAGIDSRTVLTGPVDPDTHAPALLSACDAVAVPSLSETQSLVALEAVSAGKPVAASRVGDLPLYLDQDLLVEPGNARELARVLNRLLLDREFAARTAGNAREKVLGLNSMKNYAASLWSVYQEAAGMMSR